MFRDFKAEQRAKTDPLADVSVEVDEELFWTPVPPRNPLTWQISARVEHSQEEPTGAAMKTGFRLSFRNK